jgi:hypothetical protein
MNNETAMAQGSQSGLACRLKTFDEMTDAEKIRWLHTEVKGLVSANQYLRREIEGFRRHQHGGRGEVVLPVDAINFGQGIGGLYGNGY